MKNRKNKRAIFAVLFLICLALVSRAEGEAFLYDSHGKRDPFIPLVGVATKSVSTLEEVVNPEDLKLQGIAIDSKGKRMAIMNGEMIREGQTVGRVTAKKISENRVSVSLDGEEYVITIYGETPR